MGLFWKIIPYFQALSWEPDLCQHGFVSHLIFAITVNISSGLFFKCHNGHFQERLENFVHQRIFLALSVFQNIHVLLSQ